MLNQKAQDNKKTYTVAEIADMLGIGRTSAYNLVKENHFKVVKIGASIRISKKSFDDWLDKLNIWKEVKIMASIIKRKKSYSVVYNYT